MFPILSDTAWTSPGSRFQPEKRKDPLGRCVEELSRLQFSINIAVQFADSPSQHPVRQQQLRVRITELRSQYSDKLHEMLLIMRMCDPNAKVEAERKQSSPRGIVIPFAAPLDAIDPCI